MTKRKTKPTRILLIALLILGVVLAIWYFTRPKVSAPKVASTSIETKSKNTDDANKNDPTLDKKSESTTTPAAEATTLSITVSRPVNNDVIPLAEGIELRSVISGATSGTCSLVLAGPNGKTVTTSANIAAQSSYGSCSFDVPSSDLVAGDWTLTLNATSGSASGKTTLKLKVQ